MGFAFAFFDRFAGARALSNLCLGIAMHCFNLNPAVGRLLPLEKLDESNTCAHDDLHLMGESAARPQVCRFRPLALLLAPPGQAVRGALAPSLKTCFVSP